MARHAMHDCWGFRLRPSRLAFGAERKRERCPFRIAPLMFHKPVTDHAGSLRLPVDRCRSRARLKWLGHQRAVYFASHAQSVHPSVRRRPRGLHHCGCLTMIQMLRTGERSALGRIHHGRHHNQRHHTSTDAVAMTTGLFPTFLQKV